ncbi:MAG: hypothetical protein PHF44_03445 [Candidatus Pacebacteria bacterium]|nr:hypothetical protein [Candidatus Paceibacterota bacterium]
MTQQNRGDQTRNQNIADLDPVVAGIKKSDAIKVAEEKVNGARRADDAAKARVRDLEREVGEKTTRNLTAAQNVVNAADANARQVAEGNARLATAQLFEAQERLRVARVEAEKTGADLITAERVLRSANNAAKLQWYERSWVLWVILTAILIVAGILIAYFTSSCSLIPAPAKTPTATSTPTSASQTITRYQVENYLQFLLRNGRLGRDTVVNDLTNQFVGYDIYATVRYYNSVPYVLVVLNKTEFYVIERTTLVAPPWGPTY